MALLGLTVASANKIRTGDPAKLKADSMRADVTSFDSVGQEFQTLRPAETLDDVAL
jgi:hypothetical protein